MFDLALGLEPVIQFVAGLPLPRFKELIGAMANELWQVLLVTPNVSCAQRIVFDTVGIDFDFIVYIVGFGVGNPEDGTVLPEKNFASRE